MIPVQKRKLTDKNVRTGEDRYQLINTFKGYHAREDQTKLTPDIMVSPSKNVVIGTSGRIAQVKGYKVDGSSSTVSDSGIVSSYDFNSINGVRNLRAGFLTSAGNDGKLQYRHPTAGWRTLQSSLLSIKLSFTTVSDIPEEKSTCVFANGTTNLYQWNGAYTSFASKTASVGGVISTATIATAGTGYVTGDTITVTGGAATFKVTATAGVVTSLLAIAGGSGYTVSAGVATTNTGVGTGLTVNITAIVSGFTLTKQGTTTWAIDGFNITHDKSFILNGNTYTYTGGLGTQTLFGVVGTTPIAVAGDIIEQSVVTLPASTRVYVPSDFVIDLVGSGRNNQLYIGSHNSIFIYASKSTSLYDFSYTVTGRLIGEGFSQPLSAPPIKFIPQEVHKDDHAYDMYIAEGKDTWSVMRSSLDSNLAKEVMERIVLKNAPLQAAASEKLCTKMKNHIVFVGSDNVANFLGYLSYQFVPVLTDFSYPIIDDMVSYDMTDASIFYHRNYIYIAIPKHSLVRIYNMTNQTQEQYNAYNPVEGVSQQPWFWEAPVGYPLSGFYVVNGELYGHGYYTSESYKLFTGNNFNGHDIAADATFAYDIKKDRTVPKSSNEIWVEGYMNQVTTLNAGIQSDLGAFGNTRSLSIDGGNSQYVSFGASGGSLGNASLGADPLGGGETITSDLPAWFHVAITYPEHSFYMEQLSFSSRGSGNAWELVCFGTNAKEKAESNNDITI